MAVALQLKTSPFMEGMRSAVETSYMLWKNYITILEVILSIQ